MYYYCVNLAWLSYKTKYFSHLLATEKRGRPSYVSKYLGLVPCVKSFIEQSSAEAHLRRRNDCMYTNGVCLDDIVKHVEKTLKIYPSRDTIHRLMNPPRKNTIASKYYKSLVNACVPPKRNTKEKQLHPDFHSTCAQVSIVNQMAHICRDNTLVMPVDNKNKVEVGIPATSRRTQIRSFHMVNQSPVYNDHNFPNQDCKLVPAGYQILRGFPKRSRSLSPRRKTTFPRKRCVSEGMFFTFYNFMFMQ